jgi:hypothetical protein
MGFYLPIHYKSYQRVQAGCNQFQCEADVGPAGAGRPRCDAVLALLNPSAVRQSENQRLIERRLGVEVERVEAIGLWEPRRSDAQMA